MDKNYNMDNFKLSIEVSGTDTIFVNEFVIIGFSADECMVIYLEDYNKRKNKNLECDYYGFEFEEYFISIIDAFIFINDQLKKKEGNQIENK